MIVCETKALAYVVASEGGVGGVGETLRAILPAHLEMGTDSVTCDLSHDEWQKLPAILDGQWPTVAPEPVAAVTGERNRQ
jgi:hypothetical protein